MSGVYDLSLIVFAYNEADNVGPVLTEIDEWAQGRTEQIEIVFVDDGSSDITFHRAQSYQGKTPLNCVQHSVNKGIGAALKTGVRYARGRWVTFMPADGQIDPQSLSVLLDAQQDASLDFVTSVYADRDDGVYRKILSWGVRSLIRLFHGVSMTSDGPYLFQRSDFDETQLKPDSFFLNFEFPIRMLALNKRVGVVTIHCRTRMSGRSKSSGIKTIYVIGKDLVALRIRRSFEKAN